MILDRNSHTTKELEAPTELPQNVTLLDPSVFSSDYHLSFLIHLCSYHQPCHLRPSKTTSAPVLMVDCKFIAFAIDDSALQKSSWWKTTTLSCQRLWILPKAKKTYMIRTRNNWGKQWWRMPFDEAPGRLLLRSTRLPAGMRTILDFHCGCTQQWKQWIEWYKHA